MANPTPIPTTGQHRAPSLDCPLVTSRHGQHNPSPDTPPPSSPVDHHRYVLIACTGCSKGQVLIRLPCGRRSCAVCGRIRYFRSLNRYLRLVEPARDLKLLTLTTVARVKLTRPAIRAIRSTFQKLLHRRYFRDRVRGGVYAVEVRRSNRRWEVHIHALIDASYIRQPVISSVWRKITRGSRIVDIRPVSSHGGLRYLLKHFLHPPFLDGQEHVYNRVLKGVRLVQTFGTFYRAGLPKLACTCPSCGGTAWIRVSGSGESVRRRVRDERDGPVSHQAGGLTHATQSSTRG